MWACSVWSVHRFLRPILAQVGRGDYVCLGAEAAGTSWLTLSLSLDAIMIQSCLGLGAVGIRGLETDRSQHRKGLD